jgi:hypothetical protein
VKLTITINCITRAFREPGDEVARIMRLIAQKVKGQSRLSLVQGYSGRLFDDHDNHVGELTFTETKGGTPSA